MPVSELSHGEQRELELAVALATKPQLLLLDEPMAGLGVTESARMVALLKELRKEVTIVLVEHDMEAVFALADRITVLVYGRVIASGDPDAIRSNEEVKRAYLGDQHVVVGPWLMCFWKLTASKPAMASARCCSACRCRFEQAKWSR